MGDPLGISASIIAVLQLAGTVVQYLNAVKAASQERQRLLDELISVSGALYLLKARAEQSQCYNSGTLMIESLGGLTGPLDQCQMALKRLAAKLAPGHGIRKLGKEMAWPLQKAEIKEILDVIERQKSLFIMALNNDQIGISRSIKDDVVHLKERVGQLQTNLETRHILGWLSPLEFATWQSDFLSRWQEGTGRWIFESIEFKRWLNGTNKTLFCPGIPGAGKTMLSSIVIDHLQKSILDEHTRVAYIFCNSQSKLEQTPVNLVASLLKQLLQARHSVPEDLKSLYERHYRHQTRPTLDEVSWILQSEMRNYSQVFLVIDALDECLDDDSRVVLARIRTMQAAGPVNVMITSRPVPKVTDGFLQDITIEIRASDEDVRRYVEGQMIRMAGCVARNVWLQETIKNSIVKTVDGMFLIAKCHVDSLADKTSVKAIKAALEKLPQGSHALDIAYDEAMKRINNQSEGFRSLAELVLSWTAYTKRPLTVAELQCAIAVEPGEFEIDQENLSDIKDLVSVCAGLVRVDEKSNIVSLVHHTTQEYFERIRSMRFPDAEQKIATTCLSYLLFNAFDGSCLSDEEFEARLRENVLLDYAAKHWGQHVCGPIEYTVENLASTFLKNDLKVACAVQVMFAPDDYSEDYCDYSQNVPKGMLGAHVCAYFGLDSILMGLLKRGDVAADSQDEGRRTPLSLAAMEGHEGVVRLLVARDDITADSQDEGRRTPLSWAAGGGHEAVVRLLVARDDVVTDSKDLYGRTPLSWAAGGGHEAVVRLLVAQDDAVTDSEDEGGHTPLSWAAARGHEAVVRLLVARDDVVTDSKDLYGRTSLSWAAEGGHDAVVRLLVARDDVITDSKDFYGQTPLSWAAAGGHEAVVRLLVTQDDVTAET